MKKFLVLAAGLLTYLGAQAEIRTLTITPESFDFNPTTAATTRQFLTFEHDGFTVTGFSGFRGSTIPNRFVFAGNALTTSGAFVAVTKNDNNFKIINIEVGIGVKSLSSMMGSYSVRATDMEPTWLDENRLDVSAWTEVGAGSTDVVDSRFYEVKPGMLYAGLFSTGMFSGEFNSIVLTYDSGSDKPVNPGEKVEPTIMFTQKALMFGLSATGIDLNEFIYNPNELPLSWSVSPADGGLLVSEGKLTFVNPGDYIVTASFAGSEEYLAKDITIRLEVEENLPALVGTILPATTYPTDYETLYLKQPLTEISVRYPVLGDYGIESFDRRSDNFITVYKDDVVIQKIPTDDRSQMYLDRNDDYKFWVKLNPITEAGKYKVKFPANLAKIDIYMRGVVSDGARDGEFQTDEEFVKTHSAPYTLNFTVYGDVPSDPSDPNDPNGPSDPNDPSAVQTVGADAEGIIWYDLQGNRVASPSRGLYIRVSSGSASKVLVNSTDPAK